MFAFLQRLSYTFSVLLGHIRALWSASSWTALGAGGLADPSLVSHRVHHNRASRRALGIVVAWWKVSARETLFSLESYGSLGGPVWERRRWLLHQIDILRDALGCDPELCLHRRLFGSTQLAPLYLGKQYWAVKAWVCWSASAAAWEQRGTDLAPSAYFCCNCCHCRCGCGSRSASVELRGLYRAFWR